MLKARDTYEIMRAEDVGWAANKLVLGKLSGRNAFKQRLQELGVDVASEADLNAAFARFKDPPTARAIFDEDIIALVGDSARAAEPDHYRFVSLSSTPKPVSVRRHVSCLWSGAKRWWSRVTATGRGCDPQGDRVQGPKWCGDGALFRQCHHLAAIESQGEVTFRLQLGGRIVNGVGSGHRRGVSQGLPVRVEQATCPLRGDQRPHLKKDASTCLACLFHCAAGFWEDNFSVRMTLVMPVRVGAPLRTLDRERATRGMKRC